MNISFSVLSPPVIGQASHTPLFAPGTESQSRSVLQLAGGFIFPATHFTGLQKEHDGAFGGTCDARVTRVRSGDTPSAASPLLYTAQQWRSSPACTTRCAPPGLVAR